MCDHNQSSTDRHGTTHHAEAGYQISNHSPGRFPSFSWRKFMGCTYVRTEGKSDMHDA
jgi:hypothetical protein